MAEVDHVVVVVQKVAVVEIAGAQSSVEGRPLRLHLAHRVVLVEHHVGVVDELGIVGACRRRAEPAASKANPIECRMPSRPPCDAPCRRVPSELSGKINAPIKVNVEAARLSSKDRSMRPMRRRRRRLAPRRLAVGAVSLAEERAHLVDGAPNDLQVGCGRRLVLGRAGERGKPAGAEIGAGTLERMRARGPRHSRLQGAAHLVEIRLGAGQEQAESSLSSSRSPSVKLSRWSMSMIGSRVASLATGGRARLDQPADGRAADGRLTWPMAPSFGAGSARQPRSAACTTTMGRDVGSAGAATRSARDPRGPAACCSARTSAKRFRPRRARASSALDTASAS